MNTEITETIKGYVFYDAACPVCRRWVGRAHTVLIRRGLHPVPLQAAWAGRRLGLSETDPLAEMKLLTAGGLVYGGADALVQIARRVWWAWPLFALARIPGATLVFRGLYRRGAARRRCDENGCKLPVPELRVSYCGHRLSAFYRLP